MIQHRCNPYSVRYFNPKQPRPADTGQKGCNMKNIFIAKYNAMTAASRATAEGKLMRKKALAMKLASGMTFSSALKLESDLMRAESNNAVDRIIDSVESSQALAEDGVIE